MSHVLINNGGTLTHFGYKMKHQKEKAGIWRKFQQVIFTCLIWNGNYIYEVVERRIFKCSANLVL